MDLRQFTIAVKGSGTFQGMFFTECTNSFPKATVFDRTPQTMKAIGQEVQLGQGGALRPQDSAFAQRAGQNLANPAATDVVVTFSKTGKKESVEVKSKRKLSKLSFVVTSDTSMSNVEQFVQQVIHAVTSVV